MKILCPSDFSASGNSGIEYAANVAKVMNAVLTVMYVQPINVTEGVSMFVGGELPAMHDSKEMEKKLIDLTDLVKKQFAIECDYDIEFTFGAFQNKVTYFANDYDLIVTGTNGTETLNQFYTGSHSYKLAIHASCPVLIVPEGSTYSKINRVVFVTGYNTNDILLMDQLKSFIESFNPELHIIHVSNSDSPADQELFMAFSNRAEEKLKYAPGITFKRVIDKDACGAIINYMHRSNSDMLVLCKENHDIIYNLFHESLIKKITSYESGYPILIVHK